MTDNASTSSAGETRPLLLQQALDGLAASLDGQLIINNQTGPPIDPPCWNALLKPCSTQAADTSPSAAAYTACDAAAESPCCMGESVRETGPKHEMSSPMSRTLMPLPSRHQ